MNDLNFFESYVVKREFKIDKKFILYVLLALISTSLLSYGVSNQIKISKLNNQVEALKKRGEDPLVLKKVEAIKEKEADMNQFKLEVENIKYLSESIEKEDYINDKLLTQITDNIPESIFLNALSISNKELYISGISRDKWGVAEFSKGLEYISNVDEIFISNISQSEENYNFDLNITLKDVTQDGKTQK